jgi:hypothetical protein
MIEVLDKIRQAGGTLAVVGKDLRLRVPKGLLTPADRSILVEHRDDLLRLLAPSGNGDPEREAIQWAEGLSPAAAAVVLERACRELAEITGEDLGQDEPLSTWEQAVDPISCQQCGGYMLWWDVGGRVHCQRCEPPVVSERVAAEAARLRRQARLGKNKTLPQTCGRATPGLPSLVCATTGGQTPAGSGGVGGGILGGDAPETVR